MVIDADAEDGAGRDSGVSNARAVGRMARGGAVVDVAVHVERERRLAAHQVDERLAAELEIGERHPAAEQLHRRLARGAALERRQRLAE